MAKELRKFGWRTIVFPTQLELAQRQRLLRRERPDFLILQKARHSLNRPRYYPEATCIFDIDDADFLIPRQEAAVIECMRDSKHVICGSRYTADYARRHNAAVDMIWTGSRPRSQPLADKVSPPAVAWAVSSASQYADEYALVISVLNSIKSTNWQFWLFGVTDVTGAEHLMSPLRQRGVPIRMFPFLPYDRFLKILESVSIGLAPLVPNKENFTAGKSFGKVGHYLNCRVAVVASDAIDHPLIFQSGVNGFLATNAVEFAECTERLIRDSDLRSQIARRGYADYLEHLSINSAAQKMDGVLRSMLSARP